MINVPDSPDIDVRLIPLKHGSITPTRPQKMRLLSPSADGALDGITRVCLSAQGTGCAEEGACERHGGGGDEAFSIREEEEMSAMRWGSRWKGRVDAPGWAGLRVVRSGIL